MTTMVAVYMTADMTTAQRNAKAAAIAEAAAKAKKPSAKKTKGA